MTTKIITSLVAFFGTFIFGAVLVFLVTPLTPIDESWVKVIKTNYNRQTARDITNLLIKDISNGEERRQGNYEADLAENVSEYADKSAQINDENLPSDFQAAWRKHMSVWHNYADFLQDLNNPKLRHNFDEMQIQKIQAEHISKINTTWYEVLRISKKYGAEIPRGAY